MSSLPPQDSSHLPPPPLPSASPHPTSSSCTPSPPPPPYWVWPSSLPAPRTAPPLTPPSPPPCVPRAQCPAVKTLDAPGTTTPMTMAPCPGGSKTAGAPPPPPRGASTTTRRAGHLHLQAATTTETPRLTLSSVTFTTAQGATAGDPVEVAQGVTTPVAGTTGGAATRRGAMESTEGEAAATATATRHARLSRRTRRVSPLPPLRPRSSHARNRLLPPQLQPLLPQPLPPS